MTFKRLQRLIEKYNISEDVELLSDSGWECSSTPMDGVYYNEDENHIIFTQGFDENSLYENYDYVRLK